MSAEPVPFELHRMRKAVGRLAEQGFRVLRVHPNDKRPVDPGWPEKATDDLNILDPWFLAEYNIGVACGPQPNGKNLLVIDVDIRDHGMEDWAALVAEHGIPDTATHITPSGGLHIFFDAPEGDYPAKLPGCPGIDIRRVGHQVVVPPSGRIIDGVPVEYAPANAGRGLTYYQVIPLTDWLIKRTARDPKPPRPTPQPSTQGGEFQNNADWFSDHYDFVAELEKQGYDVVRQRGDEVYLRHPTATAEWSCVVHVEDNWMYAYSTNMPAALYPDKQAGRDGNTWWTPYYWWVRTTWDGDISAAASEVNRRRQPLQAGATARAVAAAPAEGDDTPSSPRPAVPELDGDAWDRLSQLDHIRQGGWAELVAPGGLLIEALCRTSALIPPSYKLPGFSGGTVGVATLDMMGCVVAETGVGKSLTSKVGRSLVPDPEAMMPMESRVRLMDHNPGSGEGLIDAFYTTEKEENAEGEMIEVRRVRRQAIFLACDEGNAFVEVSKRKGVTIVETMNSAWSGETLGNLNTSTGGRMRHIAPQQVRFSAVINMQASNAWKLFDERMTTVGFAGRLLFGLAMDPTATGDLIAWPGTLTFPNWAHFPGRSLIFDYDPAIFAEIRQRRLASLRGDVGDSRRSQHLVLQCKIAAILAFWQDRHNLTLDDWGLAATILDYSSRVLEYLASLSAFARRDAEHSADLRRAQTEKTVRAELQDDAVIRHKGRIVTALRRHRIRTRRQIKDMSDAPRDALWLAVDDLVAEGVIVLGGEGYEMAP